LLSVGHHLLFGSESAMLALSLSYLLREGQRC
jgi:hypothetical protein